MQNQFVGSSLWSENLNNLVPFYRDTLGLKLTMESPNYVVFGGESPEAPWLGIGTHSEVHGRNSDPARSMVGIGCDNVQSEWQRLQGEGVEFIEPPTKYGDDMWIATLRDPEGNLVQLFSIQSN